MMSPFEVAPCGNPQGAGSVTRFLPSAKSSEWYLAPDPNPETLKTILQLHGCPETYTDVVVSGYVPREFYLGLTRTWKVRDAFYRLAALSVHFFMGNTPRRLTTQNVASLIVETINPQDPFIRELNYAVDSVTWGKHVCSEGMFFWPSFVPNCSMQQDLLTAIRLYVLYNIWCMNPVLLPVDFSSGLYCFTDADLVHVQSLIADKDTSLLPPNSPMPPPIMPLKPSAFPASVSQEPSSTAPVIDAELKRLLDALQNGSRSAAELMNIINVKRGTLRKRYLLPAEEKGLVEKTAPGSSSKQRYRLVPTACQVSPVAVTGATAPVMVDLKNTEKQVESPENRVSGITAVSRAHRSAPTIRLARYRRRIDVEKALIKAFRVERFLRSAFVSGTWKDLGLASKLGKVDLYSVKDGLFNPKYWGAYGGLLFAHMQCDSSGNNRSYFLGESTLLSIFARTIGLDLVACSETERAEMEKMEGVLSSAEIYLTNYYAQHFDISSDIDKPYHSEKMAMQTVAIDPFDLYRPVSKIIFHGKDRAPKMQLARLDFFGGTLLLPLTYYASSINPQLYCMMPEVPDTPVLYNSDLIAAIPRAEVILTDEIGIPLVNDRDGNYIISTVYGGIDVIDKLDRALLEGHPIRWLCFDSGDGPAEMYEKAVKVGTIFQQHGRKITFQVFDRVMWTSNEFGMDTGTYESSRVLSFDELKAEAAEYGVGVRDSNAVAPAELRDYSMDELTALKPKDFVLYPLLKEGFYCLIYGGSGVAKTWFALHLAIALTQGKAPFDKWDFRGKTPLNVLYIAGEMKLEEYGDRLRKLLAEQETNARFHLVREDLDLTNGEDQERIIKTVNKQKSQVVVFDNLSTLASNGHTEGQFEKVLALIRKLQAAGIIVILVHHENREGDFKGSGKIELVADQSLHLFPAGNGDRIALLVRAEKIRMTSKGEQTAFYTEFNPNQPTAVWSIRDLTPEERRRLDEDDPLGEVEMNVGKKRNDHRLAWRYLNDDERAVAIICDMLSGCHDDVIAANFAVRVVVVVEFKQQFGITEEALKQCMPRVRGLAEKKLGNKITPENLAPEIWNSLKDKGDKKN